MRSSQTRFFFSLPIFFLAISVLFFVPTVTFAGQCDQQQDTKQCTCFCGTKNGAEQAGADKITSEKCEATCEAQGHQMVVCAKTTRQYPSNNALCFDLQACTDQKGVFADPPFQPRECPSGWQYCFPPSAKSTLKLSTKIGDLETVGDLGIYISGLYKWMVGVAGFFAIIMVMIGGFQYVLGGAAQDQIAKAKERIKNGVIGMVLLFSVVLILQTINPQLLKLEVPRPSIIRTISVAGKNSCENLIKEGYTLETDACSKPVCGGTAVIKLGPGGKPVADGLTCGYSACSSAEEMCDFKSGKCFWCGDIVPDNKFGIKPSPSVCKQFSLSEADSDGNPWTWTTTDGRLFVERCFWTRDPNLIYSGVDQTAMAAFAGGPVTGVAALAANSLILGSDADPEDMVSGTCAEIEIKCSEVKKCTDYDTGKTGTAKNKRTNDALEDLFTKEDSLGELGPVNLETICNDDPCGAAKKEGKPKCIYDEPEDDCESVVDKY